MNRLDVHTIHRTGQPGAHQHAVNIKAGLFVLIDQDDVRPAGDGRLIHQRSRHVIRRVLVDTDAVCADRYTGAGIAVKVPPRSQRILLAGGAAKSGSRLRIDLVCGPWIAPEL